MVSSFLKRQCEIEKAAPCPKMIFINHSSMLAENSKNGLNQSTSSAKETSSTHSTWLMFKAAISGVQCDYVL